MHWWMPYRAKTAVPCVVSQDMFYQIKIIYLFISKICLSVSLSLHSTTVHTCLTSGRQSKMTVPLCGKEEHTQLLTVPGQGLLSGWDPNLKDSSLIAEIIGEMIRTQFQFSLSAT